VNGIRVEDALTAPPIDFDATRIEGPDHTLIELRGELDLAAEQWVETNLDTAHARDQCTIIDCSEVTFIDAAGIRTLLRLLDGPHRRLVNVPAPVARLLRIVDLGHLVDDTSASLA
jgi:anti-sigma B factor antagonist